MKREPPPPYESLTDTPPPPPPYQSLAVDTSQSTPQTTPPLHLYFEISEIGTYCTFFSTFLICFIFNILGFLYTYRLRSISLAWRSGSLAGFSLTFTAWGVYFIYSLGFSNPYLITLFGIILSFCFWFGISHVILFFVLKKK